MSSVWYNSWLKVGIQHGVAVVVVSVKSIASMRLVWVLLITYEENQNLRDIIIVHHLFESECLCLILI